MHAEREKQADAMRESHEAHARQLEDQLKEMLEERNQLLAEQYDEHKREAEKLVKAAADKASQLEQAAEPKSRASFNLSLFSCVFHLCFCALDGGPCVFCSSKKIVKKRVLF